MRMEQFVGLTSEAREFVKTLDPFKERRNTHMGAFSLEESLLGAWRDAEGNMYYEMVQAEPWSGGPVTFTHLVRVPAEECYVFWRLGEQGCKVTPEAMMFSWSDEDIAQA